MRESDLQTPSIVVDLDILESNIKNMQRVCSENGKQLWPMIKTHKSTEMIRMQMEAGATGFLAGTLDECEALFEAGVKNIMFAYPVAGEANLKRVYELAAKCPGFLIRIDTRDSAALIDAGAKKAGVKVNYTLILDIGLHRFGVPNSEIVALADSLREFDNLVLKGLSTHPGHVYAAQRPEEVQGYVEQETGRVYEAVKDLEAAGYKLELVTSGSTATVYGSVKDGRSFNVFHPGNYVFNDSIQMSLGIAKESECSLYVLATVISHPAEDRLIIDAGTKCLGLDKGAHGNDTLRGYGHVIGHPELLVDTLSEEVAKIIIEGRTDVKVGDKIKIIPNHACPSANFTSYLVGVRKGEIERLIEVDIRNNSTKKNVML